jgi:hypothetical protein
MPMSMPIIQNFSMSGLYEHYGSHGSCPGSKTGFIHRTMYFPHQDNAEIKRIISNHEQFVVLIQQNEYAVSLFQCDIQPILHAENKAYVIVTGMDDMTFPESVVGSFFDTLSPSSHCRRWFAINCRDKLLPDNKITPIPYGIDYWTLASRKSWTNTPMASACAQDRHLSKLCKSTVHFSKRHYASEPPRIYINFQFNLDGNGGAERLSAYQTIPHELMSIQCEPCNRYDTWGAYSQHIFVASPRGNGLDTIRTWEALMMGCIVIVRRLSDTSAAIPTVMEELYAELPVVIIDKWSELTRDFLDRTLSEYTQRTFRYDKLTMEYWIREIEAAFVTDVI